MRDKLENRLLEFFDRNQDEELTTGDAFVKFGTNMNQCRAVMQSMAERGLLERRRVVDGKARQFVYSAARAAA